MGKKKGILFAMMFVCALTLTAQTKKPDDPAVILGNCIDGRLATGKFFVIGPPNNHRGIAISNTEWLDEEVSAYNVLISCKKQFSAWLEPCIANSSYGVAALYDKAFNACSDYVFVGMTEIVQRAYMKQLTQGPPR